MYNKIKLIVNNGGKINMQSGLPYLDILIFGVIAVFLILRLKNILGSKTGYDSSDNKKEKFWSRKKSTNRWTGPLFESTECQLKFKIPWNLHPAFIR